MSGIGTERGSGAPPAGWWAQARREWPDRGALMDAFGGPDEATACGAERLRSWVEGAELGPRILARLAGEVDVDQAGIFARRHDAARALVRQLGLRSLETLLVCRSAQILAGPGPWALRVRALADFVYSQAARIHHQRRTPPRALAALVGRAAWAPVGDGLRHARLTGPGPAGPVHVNLLRVERGVRVRCVDLRQDPGDLAAAVARRGALAGVSGGFFLYSEPDIAPPLSRREPVGLLVCDGSVVGVPGLRRATLLCDPAPRIARLGPVGWTVRLGDRQWTVAACNDPAVPGPTLFNRAGGSRSPRPGVQLSGREAVGWGSGIDLLGGVLVVPGALPWEARGPVEWQPPSPLAAAMAGGPMLLGPDALCLESGDFAHTAPPITFSQDETYDQNLLPRMAAGQDAAGGLVFAAIDGRDFSRAPGFTLRMTAELMDALGCVAAMNLDGGSSKRMAVGGRVVDLSTTELVTGRGQPVGGARRRRLVSGVVFG